ncbi:ubiquitin carboxyl-terminal hydrolase 28-like, partial [Limulus polyphemus]|uniref:Ubiquitin carboxyl-terminal hydrolase 28-like n=1 Tax=Limulus polyphemus TaxID=6850 RepID=A0ABM1RZV1_LIMPO
NFLKIFNYSECKYSFQTIFLDQSDKEKVLSYSPANLNILPDDLKRYVEQDNRLFEQEIEKWDTEQTWKKDVTTMTVASSQSGDDVLLEEKSIGKNIGNRIVQAHTEYNSLQAEHAYQVHKATIAKVQQVAGTISTKGPEAGLDEVRSNKCFSL